MTPAAIVEIIFDDGERQRFPFGAMDAAQQFYERAQKRKDAVKIKFIDPTLHAGYDGGRVDANSAIGKLGSNA